MNTSSEKIQIETGHSNDSSQQLLPSAVFRTGICTDTFPVLGGETTAVERREGKNEIIKYIK